MSTFIRAGKERLGEKERKVIPGREIRNKGVEITGRLGNQECGDLRAQCVGGDG
jgi:hypothetical protein